MCKTYDKQDEGSIEAWDRMADSRVSEIPLFAGRINKIHKLDVDALIFKKKNWRYEHRWC